MSGNNKDGAAAFTFEFTKRKRKRWVDLLITELADTIIIVLSTDCKILYCGTSVHERLGWRDADLLNRDFGDLIFPDDVDAFRTTFQAGSEFIVYTKLKTREPMYPSSLQMLFIIAMTVSPRRSILGPSPSEDRLRLSPGSTSSTIFPRADIFGCIDHITPLQPSPPRRTSSTVSLLNHVPSGVHFL
ncbi:hypothetical protein BDZ89DRAFT_1129573 [Hymenopellis radicata]|nr:hypothetical protein BDZ89DRAFT_1129573 [Hymenopellis radicata]